MSTYFRKGQDNGIPHSQFSIHFRVLSRITNTCRGLWRTFADFSITMQILPGKIQELPVFDENDKTYLLGSEDFSIPLFKYEVPYGTTYAEGDMVKVFTFFDENSELVASLQLPELEVG